MKKRSVDQKMILTLQQRINSLEQENAYLKKLIPDGENKQTAIQLIDELRDTLKKAREMSEYYTDVVQNYKKLTRQYQAEMQLLLSKLRKDVKRHTTAD